MTQYFTYRGFALHRAPGHIRVLLTVFVAVVSLSVAVGIVNYQVRTGLTASGSAAWYRGTGPGSGTGDGPDAGPGGAGAATGAASQRAAADAGPLATTPLREKSPLELLDATHPHLFNQAFLFFVLGHIVALCAVPPRRKKALYVAAFLAVLVDTASPWLIRYVSRSMAWLQLGGHVLMAAAFAGMVGYPLREMWLRGEERAAADEP
ncbi:MAG: hypothetical protein ABEJ46_00100 [Gemmatimonadota bacterium]